MNLDNVIPFPEPEKKISDEELIALIFGPHVPDGVSNNDDDNGPEAA